MGLWRFLYNENLHYFPEGALEVCLYSHVPRVKRESNCTIINFVEAARSWTIGSALSLAPGCLNNKWLDSMALPPVGSCSNSKCRTYNSRKSTLDNMCEHWCMSNGPSCCSFQMVPSRKSLKQPNRTSINKLSIPNFKSRRRRRKKHNWLS